MAKVSPYLKSKYRRPLSREDGEFLHQISYGVFAPSMHGSDWWPKDVDMLVYADHLDDRSLAFEAEAWRRLATRQNFPAFRSGDWCWFSNYHSDKRPEYIDVSILMRMGNGHYQSHGYAAYRRLFYALVAFVNAYSWWKQIVSDALERQ